MKKEDGRKWETNEKESRRMKRGRGRGGKCMAISTKLAKENLNRVNNLQSNALTKLFHS